MPSHAGPVEARGLAVNRAPMRSSRTRAFGGGFADNDDWSNEFIENLLGPLQVALELYPVFGLLNALTLGLCNSSVR